LPDQSINKQKANPVAMPSESWLQKHGEAVPLTTAQLCAWL